MTRTDEPFPGLAPADTAYGRVIGQGPARELRGSELACRAYLGAAAT